MYSETTSYPRPTYVPAERFEQPRETHIVIHDKNRTQVRIMRIANDDSGLVEVEFSEMETETSRF